MLMESLSSTGHPTELGFMVRDITSLNSRIRVIFRIVLLAEYNKLMVKTVNEY